MSQPHLSEGPRAPLIVGLGGGSRPGSSTELALQAGLAAAGAVGCRTRLFGSAFLMGLPHYDPGAPSRTVQELDLLEAVRAADGLLLATPAYHAGVSGLVKNALDLLQDTAGDPRPYLDGVPVGLIVTAHGWQATGATLNALRTIVHALRGWPTPLGVTINSGLGPVFQADGACLDPRVADQLAIAAAQVAGFAQRMRLDMAASPAA